MTLINHHPDTAHVPPIKFRYLDRFVASHKTCTATLRKCLLLHNYKVTANLISINIVPRHSYTPVNLYLDSKNRAMASLHRDSFLAPLARGNWTLPGCCVGQHKRPILPGRYSAFAAHDRLQIDLDKRTITDKKFIVNCNEKLLKIIHHD